jgi:hypothetical protein
VQSLFEDGVLQRNGVAKLLESINALKVPATVQAVLGARIHPLLPDDKELLQILAVLGREFPLGLVKDITFKPEMSWDADCRVCRLRSLSMNSRPIPTVARDQAAKFHELRAATSLERLLRSQSRREEAHVMLADIYNWFTEGFDTADLKDAKVLLRELSK